GWSRKASRSSPQTAPLRSGKERDWIGLQGGTMTLYTYFRSAAAYRVRIALNLKGLMADMIPIHLQKEGGLNKKPQYRAVNPQMKVPALKLDSGDVLIQSLAIMEYLDEVHPHPALLPRDLVERAKVRA